MDSWEHYSTQFTLSLATDERETVPPFASFKDSSDSWHYWALILVIGFCSSEMGCSLGTGLWGGLRFIGVTDKDWFPMGQPRRKANVT